MQPSQFISRFLVPVCCIAIFLPFLLASKSFMKPVAKSAINYPAHDFHRDEKVAIAADPYDTADKVKIFSIDFMSYGFMPVFFVVTNDGDQPISVANMEIELITANHSKLTPESPDDIYRRLANPQARTRPSPFPLPGGGVKGTITQKERDQVESAQFVARAVEPHTTQSGFLFFDVGGIHTPLAGATMDITGVANAKGSELMYFEISLDKYLNAPANP